MPNSFILFPALLCFIFLPACSSRMEELTEKARRGDPQAQYELGICYQHGTDVPLDGFKAEEWLRRAAEQNHAEAQYELGLNADQRGNSEDALKWYRKAAEQKYAPAINDLGWCYLNGLGIGKDEKKAVELFRQAMKQEESYAINNLGLCYMQGWGVARDYEKAVSLFSKAAAVNRNPLALLNLGVCHDNGFGLPKDRKKAMEYFMQSAEQDCVDAMCHLALHYLREKEWKQAEAWFLKAAEKGEPRAFNLIGSFYTFNREVFDQEKAFYWLSKGAELNNPAAQANLAYLHETGSGGIRDLKKAFYWYQKSLALEWSIISCYFTGLYCIHGCGTEKNTERGLELLNEILEKKADDPPSLYTIAMHHWREQEYAEAYPLFMRAAKNGGMAAQYMTALCHVKGLGTGQDDFLAGCWMRLSAENGYEKARRLLPALQKRLSAGQWKQTGEFAVNHKKAVNTLYQDDYGEQRMEKALRGTDIPPTPDKPSK